MYRFIFLHFVGRFRPSSRSVRSPVLLVRSNMLLLWMGAAIYAGTWVAVAVIPPHGSYLRSHIHDVLSTSTAIVPPSRKKNCVVNGICPVEGVAAMSGETCAPCAGEGLNADVPHGWRSAANFPLKFPPAHFARRIEWGCESAIADEQDRSADITYAEVSPY